MKSLKWGDIYATGPDTWTEVEKIFRSGLNGKIVRTIYRDIHTHTHTRTYM
jgi:hypothetical protein